MGTVNIIDGFNASSIFPKFSPKYDFWGKKKKKKQCQESTSDLGRVVTWLLNEV